MYAFTQDVLALAIALRGMEAGLELELHPPERIFYYMPFMSSEDPESQDLSLKCFINLENESPEPPELNEKLHGSREYAEKHARIIERFRRYPHRNEIPWVENRLRKRKNFLKSPALLSEPHSSV